MRVSDEVVGGGSARWRMRALSGRRWRHAGLEAGYDAACWLGGLEAAGRITSDVAGSAAGPPFLSLGLLAICLLSAASGMLAGLYRGRYQRGSFDEVLGVGLAAGVTGLCLAAAGRFLIPGQRAPLTTVAAAALFALRAMLGARYVLFAVRQRSRVPASSAVKIIVFGAGSAGTQLVAAAARRSTDSEYRPVAMLDDDPAKRPAADHGRPGSRRPRPDGRVAALTGATVLVIAIARASGTVIRELTAAAEAAG